MLPGSAHRALTGLRAPRMFRLLARALLVAALFMAILAVARLHAAAAAPPSAIVVLGGGIERELLAASLARKTPQLAVIVSSGSLLPCLRQYFEVQAGIAPARLHADFRATDTLSNFTATLPLLQRAGHRHVVLVTSDGHLPRARVMAWLIWGSHGIVFSPAVVRQSVAAESDLKTVVDAVRALSWLVAGDTRYWPVYRAPDEVARLATQGASDCEPGRLPD